MIILCGLQECTQIQGCYIARLWLCQDCLEVRAECHSLKNAERKTILGYFSTGGNCWLHASKHTWSISETFPFRENSEVSQKQMLRVKDILKCPMGNSQQSPAGDSLDVTWGMDLRDAFFAPYKSACPVGCGGEECSLIRSFICSMCAYSVHDCAGYWGHSGDGDTQTLLSWSPQGSSKIPESWKFLIT